MTIKKRTYKRENEIPLLARNPFLSINLDEDDSDDNFDYQANNAFFVELSSVIKSKGLNRAFDQGNHYLSKKFANHPQEDEILFDYLSESMDVIFSFEPSNPEEEREYPSVIEDGQEIQTNYSFFVSVHAHKKEAKVFWKKLEEVFATNVEEDGYQFKLLPVVHTAKQLEALHCDGLFELKNNLALTERKPESIYIQEPQGFSRDSNDAFVRGVIFGEVVFTPQYIHEHIDDMFDNVVNRYDSSSSKVNTKDLHIAPSVDYADALKELFCYEVRTRVGDLIQKNESIDFESIEIEVNDDDNQITLILTHDDEMDHIEFYWPSIFMSIYDTNIDDLAKEVMHLDEMVDHQIETNEDIRRILLNDDDNKMNKTIDKFIVNQELNAIINKSKLH